MTETTPSPLGNVITIDDERIKSHLDRVVRGSVEETLNALLDAEADRLCNAQRYERRVASRVFRTLIGAERRPALAYAVMTPLISCSFSSSMFR